MACLGCGQAILVEPEWAGATRACPKCGRPFVMPGPGGSMPPPLGGPRGLYEPSGGDRVAQSSILPLSGTKGWVIFIGVMLCICTVFGFVGVIGMGAAMSEARTGMESFFCFMMIAYGVAIAFYLAMGVQLFKYGSAIGQLEGSRLVGDLDRALVAQRAAWKLFGILFIIGIALGVIGIIFAISMAATYTPEVYDPTFSP
jgi:hypothetical protein